jgi:hypothetical protein
VALRWLEDHAPVDTLNAQDYTQGQFPEEDLHWNPNDHLDYQQLEQYQEALLGGMKEGGEKGMNMSQKTEVHQGPGNSPSQFDEQICEAFGLYTPFYPEGTENQRIINAFVSQAQGDIR